jgi:hypothetical protein
MVTEVSRGGTTNAVPTNVQYKCLESFKSMFLLSLNLRSTYYDPSFYQSRFSGGNRTYGSDSPPGAGRPQPQPTEAQRAQSPETRLP